MNSPGTSKRNSACALAFFFLSEYLSSVRISSTALNTNDLHLDIFRSNLFCAFITVIGISTNQMIRVFITINNSGQNRKNKHRLRVTPIKYPSRPLDCGRSQTTNNIIFIILICQSASNRHFYLAVYTAKITDRLVIVYAFVYRAGAIIGYSIVQISSVRPVRII